MIYTFIHDGSKIITTAPKTGNKTVLTSSGNSIVETTVESMLAICNLEVIDYQKIIDDGLYVETLPTDENLIVDISSDGENTRKVYILAVPINLEAKKAGMKTVMKVYNPEGEEIDSVDYYRTINENSTITIDSNVVNEYNYLSSQVDEGGVGLFNTCKSVIIKNDLEGLYN